MTAQDFPFEDDAAMFQTDAQLGMAARDLRIDLGFEVTDLLGQFSNQCAVHQGIPLQMAFCNDARGCAPCGN